MTPTARCAPRGTRGATAACRSSYGSREVPRALPLADVLEDRAALDVRTRGSACARTGSSSSGPRSSPASAANETGVYGGRAFVGPCAPGPALRRAGSRSRRSARRWCGPGRSRCRCTSRASRARRCAGRRRPPSSTSATVESRWRSTKCRREVLGRREPERRRSAAAVAGGGAHHLEPRWPRPSGTKQREVVVVAEPAADRAPELHAPGSSRPRRATRSASNGAPSPPGPDHDGPRPRGTRPRCRRRPIPCAAASAVGDDLRRRRPRGSVRASSMHGHGSW